jgi:hypothetical protein
MDTAGSLLTDGRLRSGDFIEASLHGHQCDAAEVVPGSRQRRWHMPAKRERIWYRNPDTGKFGYKTVTVKDSTPKQQKRQRPQRERGTNDMPPRRIDSGDFTGKKAQQLAEEKAVEIREAQQRVGMVTTVENENDEYGIYDAATGQLVVDLSPEEAARLEEEEALDDGDEDVEDVVPISHQAPVPEVDLESLPNPDEMVVLRVNTDVEDMTYGRGNFYTFMRGKKYRAPRYLRDHLADKGLLLT